MRGEHRRGDVTGKRFEGSPPHARGTRTITEEQAEKLRITPACAGNTVSSMVPFIASRDHPRMRGEHEWCELATFGQRGSPPHARGTRLW